MLSNLFPVALGKAMLKRILNHFKKEPTVIDLTDGEKRIIRRYAEKDWSVEDLAIGIYNRYVPILGPHGKNIYMNFMSEATNPVPDLSMRAIYRRQVLEDK